jgi:hypothetical protein
MQILYSNCTSADMWDWACMSAVVQYYRGPRCPLDACSMDTCNRIMDGFKHKRLLII